MESAYWMLLILLEIELELIGPSSSFFTIVNLVKLHGQLYNGQQSLAFLLASKEEEYNL